MLKIALLQLSPCGTSDENLEKGLTYCRTAKEKGADVALFPEMRNNGCRISGGVPASEKSAVSVDSEEICLFQADGKEGVFVAELDVERLRAYRNSEVHGNAYRRPEIYGMLTDRKIEEPFIRADRRE